MKVKVSYRNGQSGVAFENAIADYNKLSKKKQNNTPKPKRTNAFAFVCEEIDADEVSTIAFVKNYVLEQLAKFPINDSYQLQSKNILLFEIEGGHMELVDEDANKNIKDVKKDKTNGNLREFHAFEVVDHVPADMFRTVRLDEIYPSTLCLPKNKGLTEVSPFMTAALPWKDQKEPWYYLSEEEGVCVRGISLFGEDTAVTIDEAALPVDKEKFNPFKHVPKDKDVTYKITLQEYQRMIDTFSEGKGPPSELYGILETSLSHEVSPEGDEFSNKSSKIVVSKDEKATRGKTAATYHDVYFRFVLEKGADLKKHGMVLVFDNMGPYENHFSLVRDGELNKKQHNEYDNKKKRSWLHLAPNHDNVFLPEPVLNQIPENEDLNRMLSPQAEFKQPETIYKIIQGKGLKSLVFPCLAAEYKLHDFVIRAGAEPLPLDDFNDDQEIMYKAALVLFNAIQGPDYIYNAIKLLEEEKYIVQNIDRSIRTQLIMAMESVDEEDISHVNFQELGIDEDLHTVLDEGITILEGANDNHSLQTVKDSMGDLKMEETKTPHHSKYEDSLAHILSKESPSSPNKDATSVHGDTPDTHSTSTTVPTNEPQVEPLLPCEKSSSNEYEFEEVMRSSSSSP